MQFATISTILMAVFCASSTYAKNASSPQAPKVHPTASAPTYAGTWSPSAGFVPATGPGSARSGPDTLFSNAAGPYYSYSYPGAGQEWIDEGVLRDRNHDFEDQINGMAFLYNTNSVNPNGVNLNLNFYDETIACSGPPAWPNADCSYQLAGLPGSTNGTPTTWVIQLDFAGVECNLPTNEVGGQLFGMGMEFGDSSSGPITGSGGYGAKNGAAWFDVVNGTYNGCMTFGAQSGFAFDLYGPAAETEAFHSASPGTADNLFLSANTQPQVGVPVTLSVTSSPGGSGVGSMLWVSPNRVDRHLLGTPYALDAHVLANYATNVLVNRAAGGHHVLTLPGPAGGGKTWYVQGATIAGGAITAMSHGVEIYVH